MSVFAKKKNAYLKRKCRIRKKVFGAEGKPRLNVYKSNNQIYAQIIDDIKGITLASASSLNSELKDMHSKGKIEISKRVGELIAKNARALGIDKVVFDRGGFLYHGRVRAVADGAREAGLKF